MTDAITDAPSGPVTDTLGEQTELPNPQTNTIPEDDAPEASPAEKRSKSINKAIDDALDDKPAKKAEPKAKDDNNPAEGKEPKAKEPTEDKAEPVDADAPKAEPKEPIADDKPKATSYRDPPSGFDDAAKADWEAVPESVRGAVNRRTQDLERGLEKYRADAQEFESVRQYAETAKQGGTDLATALQRYTTMENALRQDPITGLQGVVANLGLKKPDGSSVTLRDVAASIMGQTPDQAASKQEATISRLTQQLQEVTQQIGGFSKHVEQQQTQAKTATAKNEWGAFQSDNPRAKELEAPIAEFLTKYPSPPNMPVSERLADAYAYASAKFPEGAHTAAQPLVQTQAQATPNPAGQKSISGSPGGKEATNATRKLNRSDAVDKAMRAAGL